MTLRHLYIPFINIRVSPGPSGRWWVALWSTLALCAAARVGYLLSPKVAFSADEAVTGIMTRQILAGHRPAFYAGQHYGGTLEQYLQALLYALTPLPQNAFTLRLAQVTLSVLTCALVYLVGVRILAGPGRAVLASLLFAVGPWFNVVGTATSQGFYVVGQTLGLATWCCALWLPDTGRDTGAGSRTGTRWAGLLGLFSGLALWSSVTAVYFTLPALLWAVPSLGRRAAGWLAYGIGGLLGAGPVVWQLLAAGTLPLQTGVPVATSPGERLHHLFGPVLREFLGVAYGHDTGGLPRPVQYAAVGTFLAAYVVALWRRRHGLRTLLRPNGSRRQPVDLLLLVPPIVMLSYAASPSVWYVGTPRYLLVAYPLLPLGVVAALPRLRPGPAIAAGAVSTLAVGALTLGFFRTQTVSWRAQEPELRQVLAVLVERNERAVFADYWTAMPLLYLSDGRVQVGVSSGTSRFPGEQRAALAAAAPSYVMTRADGSAGRLTAALAARNVTFRTTRVGRLVIVDHLGARVEPADLP